MSRSSVKAEPPQYVYCEACHTRWSEWCVVDTWWKSPGEGRCPFRDCHGLLTNRRPVPIRRRRPLKKEELRYPLLEAIDAAL